MNTAAELDIGPLTWVKGEIDLALDRAAEALERHGVGGGETSQLTSARSHLHQAHGALSIVGLDGLTRFSDALEQMLEAVADGHLAYDEAVAQASATGIAAIRHYLDDLVGGQTDQPLRLLPAYQALAIARGQPVPAPSELFFPDLSLRPPRREREPDTLAADELRKRLKAARLVYQRGLLKWLKNDPRGVAEMREALVAIEMTQVQPSARAFWWVGQAFLDALAAGTLPVDFALRRLCARIDTQIKRLLEGSRTVAERLMRDSLYYIAIAGPAGDHAECVRAAYRLGDLIPRASVAADIEPLKPVLRAAREQLAQAMDDWNRFCAGTAAALPQFHDRIRQLMTQIGELGQADLARLTAVVVSTADYLRRAPLKHNETIGLEVATGLLLMDNALENFQNLAAEFSGQVVVVAGRLNAALRGEPVAAMEVPHLDEMSRRAQEKLLMNQVVKEIQANLGTIEQTLDAFFRNPLKSGELTALGKPLKQVEGALAVLGQDRAVVVLRECEAVVEGFAKPAYQPQQADFEDVARKLSAIGFFVEQLRHGAANIDAILTPPAPAPVAEEEEPAGPSVEAELEAARRATQTLVGALLEQPEDEELRGEIKQNLEVLRENAQLMDDTTLAEQAKVALAAIESAQPSVEIEEAVAQIAVPEPVATAPSAEATRLADASREEIDAELLGIFIEEAHEVLATIGDLQPQLAAHPHDRDTLTTVRRGFHTLKGSGRMVGLGELGEAAWAVEQLLNRWLQQEREATADLRAVIAQAHRLFEDWVAQLESGGGLHREAGPLVAACEALLAEGGAQPPLPVAAAEPEPAIEIAAATEEPIELEDVHLAAAIEDLLPPLDFGVATEPEAQLESPAAPLPEVDLEPALTLDLTGEPTAPPEHLVEPTPEPEPAFPSEAAVESVQIGSVSLSPTLFELYVNEALGHVATLGHELAVGGPPRPALIRAAHTLGGISATTGLVAVEALAHALESALGRLDAAGATPNESQQLLLARVVGALEGMVGAIAERRLPHAEEALVADLATVPATPEADVPAVPVMEDFAGELEYPEALTLAPELTAIAAPEPAFAELPASKAELVELPPVDQAPPELVATLAEPAEELPPDLELPSLMDLVEALPEAPAAEAAPAARTTVMAPRPEVRAAESIKPERRNMRLADDLDAQLLPIFLEEGIDLMREIGSELRAWRGQPDDVRIAEQLKRLLHTLKGSARMAGAMGIGELVHSMETRIEDAVAAKAVTPGFLDKLDTSFDRASMLMDRIQSGAELPAEVEEEVEGEVAAAPAGTAAPAPTPAVAAKPVPAAPAPAQVAPARPDVVAEAEAAAKAMLRVRADLVDRLVNEAGEMAIVRGRIEGEMRALKNALLDLTENVIRLRSQLREVEIQAESQMQSRQAEAAEHSADFDPLEFDRFTRFQELTRMMAESVNDVATAQHSLLQNLDHADAAITAQARLNRELSQSLMGVRMVPFNTTADRLYRVVRLTAKEVGKRANLDIRGGQTELDRSVLEKMTGPLEHLLRNAITHGLELPAQRLAAGKADIGEIGLRIAQEGNEIVIELADDGNGLDLERIRAKAIQRGLLTPETPATPEQLTQMIFQSGFSTAEELTALAGRGVGMDVVKNETASLGGRIEVDTAPGRGTRFLIYLPLTLAVIQAVLVRSGGRHYAIPSSMIAQVNEMKPPAIAAIRAEGSTTWLGVRYPWHYLPRLLGETEAQPLEARRHWLLLVRSGTQHIAVEVDEMVGNQELVVKNIGPQLARVVGIAGATVLGDGEIALILNPVALASREARVLPVPTGPVAEAAALAVSRVGTVMVVDDSLTVRKITGRLLAREGYQVLTAKDGVDALEQLIEVLPDVMLVDIEMPRMDGFDLTRNVRADARLRDLPIIMITSRIADKHRNYATELGVDHYLGKPYDEEELLKLIAGYVNKAT